MPPWNQNDLFQKHPTFLVLTDPDLPLLRRIRRFMPVLWVLIRFDRPLTESEIAAALEMNLETIRGHLRCLSKEGLVAYLGRNKGWVLIPGGRQLLLPGPSPSVITTAENPRLGATMSESENGHSPGKSAFQESVTEQTAEKPRLEEPRSEVEVGNDRGKSAVQGRDLQITAENPRFEGENIKINAENPRFSLEEEDLKLKNLNLDSPPPPSKPEIQTLDVRELLKASQELLGEPIKGSPKHFKDPARLLGWIAYAYDNRRGLHHPARLAYRRYHSDHELDPPYLEHPIDYLPGWFLERTGLQGEDHPEDDCEDGSDYELSIDLDCEDPPPENPDLSPQAVRWWEACLAQLQSDLPKAVFNSWVSSLRAFSWDEDSALLTLAIPNQYARDWLDSRLKTTIQHCLTGIANRDLTVRILTLPTP
jgi:hypothetical protein